MAIEAEKRAVMLGKKYRCEVCNTEVLCSKGGIGPLVCCDKEMAPVAAKPVPPVRETIVVF